MAGSQPAYLTGVASQVVGAGSSILAGVRGALVHLFLAVAAGVACLAAAEVRVAGVYAEAGVPAQVRHVDPWESTRPGRAR